MNKLWKSKLSYIVATVLVLGLMAATNVINWKQINPLSRHGTGAYGQASDGTGTSGHCAQFSSDGSMTDAGAPCGSGGSGGGGIVPPALSYLVPNLASFPTSGSGTTPTFTYVAGSYDAVTMTAGSGFMPIYYTTASLTAPYSVYIVVGFLSDLTVNNQFGINVASSTAFTAVNDIKVKCDASSGGTFEYTIDYGATGGTQVNIQTPLSCLSNQLFILRVHDDGTYFYYQVSADGVNWVNLIGRQSRPFNVAAYGVNGYSASSSNNTGFTVYSLYTGP